MFKARTRCIHVFASAACLFEQAPPKRVAVGAPTMASHHERLEKVLRGKGNAMRPMPQEDSPEEERRKRQTGYEIKGMKHQELQQDSENEGSWMFLEEDAMSWSSMSTECHEEGKKEARNNRRLKTNKRISPEEARVHKIRMQKVRWAEEQMKMRARDKEEEQERKRREFEKAREMLAKTRWRWCSDFTRRVYGGVEWGQLQVEQEKALRTAEEKEEGRRREKEKQCREKWAQYGVTVVAFLRLPIPPKKQEEESSGGLKMEMKSNIEVQKERAPMKRTALKGVAEEMDENA